ncbi:MAG TPA: glycosyltransferase [Micropepsaceae bacterium]|jgi:hopene-associated glycosyltransferase HpnB|nr:glycosyltransferase [Micropepsaceae bacterium]
MMFVALVSVVALAAWIYLLAFRGMFWRMRERDDGDIPFSGGAWPSVTAIVPARDEAAAIAQSLASLLAQDYPGDFRIVLVDDQSSDGTAETAQVLDNSGRLEVLRGAEPPAGWTGKLWALKQGTVHAAVRQPDYFWFTDADIAHTHDNLRQLVGRAQRDRLVMVSLMAKLRCESFAERLLIPAYVFFFAMLFPFSRVNRPKDSMAAAAGGCILLEREALERAGGIDSIRREIIDDCALGRRMKMQGPIWLGLTERAVSLRPYPQIRDIGQMVARSAYAQLGYSPLLLAGTLAGMLAIYAAPPFIALFGTDAARVAAGLAWCCMAVAFQPMLIFYRRSAFWGLTLPLIGILYAAFTVDSAIQYWRGRGGMWKGRIQTMTRA